MTDEPSSLPFGPTCNLLFREYVLCLSALDARAPAALGRVAGAVTAVCERAAAFCHPDPDEYAMAQMGHLRCLPDQIFLSRRVCLSTGATVPSILLVEDDEHVRKPLEMLLSFERYEVTAAENAAKAAFLLGWKPFDLLLTDVSLPDGNGLAIADKANEIGMPALVVTGYTLGLKPGSLDGYDYLLKPVRERALLEAIRRRLPCETRVVPFVQRSTRN